MAQNRCPECGNYFSEPSELKTHGRICPRKAFNKGPTFKNSMSKPLKSTRRKLQGTYEWALDQSNKSTCKKLKAAFIKKSKVELKNEIVRLEKLLVFNDSPSDRELKRQVAISHALYQKNQKKIELTQQKARRIAAVRELELKKQLLPEREKSNDIMDVYYKSGARAVVSGGLPSLGKRK